MSKGMANQVFKNGIAWTGVAAAGILGGSLDVSDAEYGVVGVLVNTTAASGTTPSMTITVQWSFDGTTWAANDGAAETFAAITATGATAKQFPVKAPYMRLNATTVSGTTPSFTGTASVIVL